MAQFRRLDPYMTNSEASMRELMDISQYNRDLNPERFRALMQQQVPEALEGYAEIIERGAGLRYESPYGKREPTVKPGDLAYRIKIASGDLRPREKSIAPLRKMLAWAKWQTKQ